jgi:hypothetical protein
MGDCVRHKVANDDNARHAVTTLGMELKPGTLRWRTSNLVLADRT